MDHLKKLSTVLCFLLVQFGVEGRGLSYSFYQKSCPQVEDIVRAALGPIFLSDPSSPPAFLRLLFHDCQVQGCDASILVDPADGKMPLEMASSKNFGVRKRESISLIKSVVEAQCPGTVSCADILVMAARDAVAFSGGPWIKVPFGRRDSSRATSYKLADALLPPANLDVNGLLQIFTQKGMTIKEAVAIIGAHTIGITHCLNIRDRLQRPEGGGRARGMEPGFEAFLRLSCPEGSLISNSTFVVNDPSAFTFDNHYYSNAMHGRGILRVDAEVSSDSRTAPIVSSFAADQSEFFRAFASAFVKLSASGVLTGNQGVIRKSCNRLN
ncbi:peroxidase 29 [Vitis riparia]|uniref:peroxidase 29 n=1 Tax=Vitis riparia TaxID=96939 RepID=UPI00155ABC58|nr:peroxidase 29 [Vitis riparia]